jgi:DNA-binding LytR/AlgR family response regulator
VTRATAIVAEDEVPQQQELARLLAAVWPELTVLGAYEDGLSALEALTTQRPDVAFLDIRMPGISGLELARQLGPGTQIVFITAYAEHALRAFEEGAIDYLLKPVSRGRLAVTVERLRSRVEACAVPEVARVVEALQRHARSAPKGVRWVSASVGNTIKMLPLEEILFFQSRDKYTRVVTSADEAVIRTPLKDLLEMLDPDEFWQVHRSAIVRVAAVRAVVRTADDKNELVVAGSDERLPVSPAFKRFKGM